MPPLRETIIASIDLKNNNRSFSISRWNLVIYRHERLVIINMTNLLAKPPFHSILRCNLSSVLKKKKLRAISKQRGVKLNYISLFNLKTHFHKYFSSIFRRIKASTCLRNENLIEHLFFTALPVRALTARALKLMTALDIPPRICESDVNIPFALSVINS